MREIFFERLCIVGSYPDSELYSRNIVTVRFFLSAFKNVDICRSSIFVYGEKSSQLIGSIKKIIFGFKTFLTLIKLSCMYWRYRDSEVVFVPYPSLFDVLVVLFIKRPRYLIIDGFVSYYDTVVNDRKILKRDSLLARLLWVVERFVYLNVNRVLIDTDEHAVSVAKEFGLDSNLFYAIPVGINESIWSVDACRKVDISKFKVFYWGTFIPLHGVEKIINAAKLLESEPSIEFCLIGSGQEAKKIRALIEELRPKNLVWEEKIYPIEFLRDRVSKADLVLGVFGDSNKSKRVLPYKLYQACSMNLNVLTQKSNVLSRIDSEGCIFTSESSPESIAFCINEIKSLRPIPKTKKFYDRELSNKVVNVRLNEMLSSDLRLCPQK